MTFRQWGLGLEEEQRRPSPLGIPVENIPNGTKTDAFHPNRLPMKSVFVALAILFACLSHVRAQAVPELIYYKFDGTGATVPNLASAPVGTNPATIEGDQTQGGTGQFGGGLIGTGSNSSTNYVNTGWAPNLTDSWTLSLHINNVSNYSQLWYIFGDVNSGGFRCFTNGVAGPDNFWMRGGGLTDVAINGGAAAGPQVMTFVYDDAVPEVRAYLNGVLVNTVAQGPSVALSGSGPLKVGGYSSNNGLAPGSVLDEFRLYNRALSGTEVAATWNKTLPLAPAITLTGNGTAITNGDIDADPSDDTDFGTTPTLGGSVARTFTIGNEGTDVLNLTGNPLVTVTGSPAFSVTTQPAANTVAEAATETFVVTFDPSAPGIHDAVVSIASDDPDDDPFTFAVTGVGIAPAGAPKLRIDRRPAPFSETKVNTEGGTQVVKFTNVGSTPANRIVVVLKGKARGDYRLVQPRSTTLAPGSTTSFSATFEPRKAGTRAARVFILSDGAPTGTVLTGRGVDASKPGGTGHLPTVNY